MLKPKVDKDKNWILAGRGSIDLPPVVRIPVSKERFNQGTSKNKAPIKK